MLLNNDDVTQYYRLVGGLHFFVNQRLKLVPKVTTRDEYEKLDATNKKIIRDATGQIVT